MELQDKLYDYIKDSSKRYGKNIAFEFMGNSTTYQTLINQIDRAANALSAIGVKEDDIICIAMPNMPQALILIYGANKIGAVVNMIHPLSSENEMLSFVNRVQAKTVLILDQFANTLLKNIDKTSIEHLIVASASDCLNSIQKLGYRLTQGRKIKVDYSDKRVVTWQKFVSFADGEKEAEEVMGRQNKTALILHSGGTTGKVKGVCLSNNNVNSASKQIIDANPMLEPTDSFLSVMPIFHGNGLVVGVHSMLMFGVRCVLIPRFTPESYAKDLLKYKCNYMSGVPVLFQKLTETKVMKNADLSFLKGVYSGADFLSVEIERRINSFLSEHNANVRIRQGYGMTEGVVATTLNPVTGQREGSIGLPLKDVFVKIVKPGTEEEAEVGEAGEIVFSSTTNMLGYYNDPEETALTIKKHADGKMWIHSGDLGYKDLDGFFYFKSRIKRMIVTNGYNVFPNELENIIEGFEMVDRCCVLGVNTDEGTDKIKAFIVLKPGFEKSDETKTIIKELCKKDIAKYALPKEIVFIDEMPKTKVGKTDYNSLLANQNKH